MNLLSMIALALCARTVAGFSNGKVRQACNDMIPQHGHESSTDPPPYNISVDRTTFSPGDRITVTLRAPPSGSSSHFKGFLIQARDAGKPGAPALGTFGLVDPRISQLLQCGNTQGSGVSHTSDSKKTEVKVMWESSQDPPESVQFLVTVVQKYKVYWVKIPGPVVSLKGGTIVPTSPTSSSPTTDQTTPAILPTPFSSQGCGDAKSCVRDPVGCDPRTDSQCSFLSFATEERSVRFELSGPAEGYVSFALSLDKWMGNDDVYLCVRDGDVVNIEAAYVSGRKHPEVASQSGLWDKAWRLSDGVIQCRFRRDVFVPQQGEQSRFSLNQSFYLFLANGRAEDGFIHRHDRQPLISTNQKVITGPPEDLIGSRSPLLIKFHGAFMLIGWMLTVSTGVFVARHFKQDWPDRTLLGHRVWFQVHRTLMAVSVVLTCVAFSLPFIYRGGWSKRAGSHPYLGCTVMALCVIQPIIALLRPAPESPRRFVFNWVHLGTGTFAQILAVACVFLGVQQQALLLPGSWSAGVVAGWLIWSLLLDLVLQIHARRLRGKNEVYRG
ncbi:putative ferric-chelate reductase 1 [Aplochiton taeniatus]